MTFIRSVTTTTFFVLFLSVASVTTAGSAGSGSTEGSFVGIEQGDYAHFLIKDKNGQDDSFIILRPDKSVQQYLDNPAKLKGRAVKVYWKEETIPEAGGPMKTVFRVTSDE